MKWCHLLCICWSEIFYNIVKVISYRSCYEIICCCSCIMYLSNYTPHAASPACINWQTQLYGLVVGQLGKPGNFQITSNQIKFVLFLVFDSLHDKMKRKLKERKKGLCSWYILLLPHDYIKYWACCFVLFCNV
jgi:hypothetical protein